MTASPADLHLPRDMADTAALIALLRSGRRPWSQYAELVEEAGSASAVLELEQSETLLPAEPLLADAAADITRWHKRGIAVLSVLDAHYPQNLSTVHDRPPLVFVSGRLLPQDAQSVAVVGARLSDESSLDHASRVATHLTENGYTVVSGLAAGIDTAAHQGALAAGGRTLAVIGTGLGRAYPPQNEKLQAEIATRGAVISRFWPDSPPGRHTFPLRNAVISGITRATVIVDARAAGGSRLQARLALHQTRPLILLPGVLRHAWGRELAHKPGVHLVHSAREITELLAGMSSATALVT